MFRKILIANRGESAIRVIRACRELGISCVTMHVEGEKGAVASDHADEDYLLIKKGARSPYLDMEQIVSIAKISGAEAIHPGYGFLSESADFARMCGESGIVFIGPSAATLKRSGNKIEAKKLVSDLGIPTIPGYAKAVNSVEQILAIASDIGFPIVLKAAGGGGGRGIRLVGRAEEAEAAFQSVKREATAAFGNSDIYVEKSLAEPRHIEIQILGDGSGSVVHLFERECSVQRRNQKLIEETPSPALTPELRREMGETAVRIGKALRYSGAGSVEFLFHSGKFYFMEINSRLQVEHGITEKVTGIDIVKEQIRIAHSGVLSFSQESLAQKGWAIECRINAESVLENFKPSWGIITRYVQPSMEGVSISSGVKELSEVSPLYDSMIAKLVAHGSDRNEAIGRALDALSAFVIKGVDTTVELHREILQDPAFLKGELSTSFITKHGIIERMRGRRNRVLIAAAVSHYLRTRVLPDGKSDDWVMAGRLESISSEAQEW